MKRTPLIRRTPLKRKKPMRRVSTKRRKLNALMNPQRTAFVLFADKCMVCDYFDACDCHEICRGSHREKCLEHPRLWLAVCRECHEKLDDAKKWPLARQIACRIDWEIRQTVKEANEVRGRAQTALRDADIYPELDL